MITISPKRARAAILTALTDRLGSTRAQRLLDQFQLEVEASFTASLPIWTLDSVAEIFTIESVRAFDKGYRVTVSRPDGRADHFVTDLAGVVQRAPRGFGRKYRPGRLSGLAERVRSSDPKAAAA